MLEPAHIAGVLKTGDAPATPPLLGLAAWPPTEEHEGRPVGLELAGSVPPVCWVSSRWSPRRSVGSCRPRPRRPHHRVTSFPKSRLARLPKLAVTAVMRSARLAGPSPAAPRSSMSMSRVSPTSIQLSSRPCVGLRPMPRPPASSWWSTAAGVPRRTRSDYSTRRSGSTARRRKLPAGLRPPPRLLTCRGTPSTSGLPMPQRGFPTTAPRTGCARSTATSPGTTNCAPTPSITDAHRCTPTLRTIRGCSRVADGAHRSCPAGSPMPRSPPWAPHRSSQRSSVQMGLPAVIHRASRGR